MSIQKLFSILKGGSGSGNFGHGGIPGHVGGSKSGVTGGDMYEIASEENGIPDELNGDFKKSKKNFDTTSLIEYSEGGYKETNRYLRKGILSGLTSYEQEQAKRKIESMIQGIDKAMEKSIPLKRNMKVFRGVNQRIFDTAKVGSIISDKSYTSTSLKKSIADARPETGFIFEINLPKGTKGIYLASVSKHKNEQEFLLPRDAKFKVLNKSGNKAVLEIVKNAS